MMTELGDLRQHVDEAEGRFRRTEEQYNQCRARLVALIAAVETRLRDNRTAVERNRAEYDRLTESGGQLDGMGRKLRETLGNSGDKVNGKIPRAIERAAQYAQTEDTALDDPAKIRQGLRRALTRARAPKTSVAPGVPPTV